MTDQPPPRRVMEWLWPPRLLPWALVAMAALAVVKLERLLGGTTPPMAAALASVPPAAPSSSTTRSATPVSAPPASAPPVQVAPEAQAERALLESLRSLHGSAACQLRCLDSRAAGKSVSAPSDPDPAPIDVS